MKQKIVIRVQITSDKCRTKALKFVVGQPGIISAAIEGKDKDEIVVIGEGVDSVKLTRLLRKGTLLRKGLGVANIVYVEEKKEEKKEEKEEPISLAPYIYHPSVPQPYVYEVPYMRNDSCSIL